MTRWTNERLLERGREALQCCSDRILTRSIAIEHGLWPTTVRRHFQSWNDFLLQLGCSIQRRPRAQKETRTCTCGCGESFTVSGYNKRRFFSTTCANRASGLARKLKSVCPVCGGRKTYQARRCHNCRMGDIYRDAENKPISCFFRLGSARTKYVSIRAWAKKVMTRGDIEKKCAICGFSIVVDACHIRPISDFPPSALMGEVNDLNNLIYLCPNHHALHDRGLLSLLQHSVD